MSLVKIGRSSSYWSWRIVNHAYLQSRVIIFRIYSYAIYIVSLDTHWTAPPGHCNDWRPCDNELEKKEKERWKKREMHNASWTQVCLASRRPRAHLPSPSSSAFSLLTRPRLKSGRLYGVGEAMKTRNMFYDDYNNRCKCEKKIQASGEERKFEEKKKI